MMAYLLFLYILIALETFHNEKIFCKWGVALFEMEYGMYLNKMQLVRKIRFLKTHYIPLTVEIRIVTRQII